MEFVKTTDSRWIPRDKCVFYLNGYTNNDSALSGRINSVIKSSINKKTISEVIIISFNARIIFSDDVYDLATLRLSLVNEGLLLDDAETLLNKRYFIDEVRRETADFVEDTELFVRRGWTNIRTRERTLKAFNLSDNEKKMALLSWNISDGMIHKLNVKGIDTLADLFPELQEIEKKALPLQKSEEETLAELWGLSESESADIKKDIEKLFFLKKTILEILEGLSFLHVTSENAKTYLRLFELPKSDYLNHMDYSLTSLYSEQTLISLRDEFCSCLGEIIM